MNKPRWLAGVVDEARGSSCEEALERCKGPGRRRELVLFVFTFDASPYPCSPLALSLSRLKRDFTEHKTATYISAPDGETRKMC